MTDFDRDDGHSYDAWKDTQLDAPRYNEESYNRVETTMRLRNPRIGRNFDRMIDEAFSSIGTHKKNLAERHQRENEKQPTRKV